ncbi:DUF3040 domain-containing protein [Actinomadura decatromicini]|uniref:DUF3040 domain-containing protein n=1 Tax=Actinomadura decatromicini TaxID=2604572 RepID=A0A5D3FKZ7_9ACTN|nr:DUF3040 domain-containing protein [Actinomadura decatromicini]TYK47855.1 DUF3040 domain-containing protein [Actinomadura decatromicini]
MPLSEHEQRMLEQIESALYAEDPKFAHAVRSTNPQVHYKRRIVKAAFGFVVGVGALMAGLVINQGSVTIAVSVTGFLLMVACCVWALTSWKRMTGIGTEPAARGGGGGGGGRSSRPAKAGFMERMEERWRRRTEGD